MTNIILCTSATTKARHEVRNTTKNRSHLFKTSFVKNKQVFKRFLENKCIRKWKRKDGLQKFQFTYKYIKKQKN